MAFVENMFKRNVMVYNSLKPKYDTQKKPFVEPKIEVITDEKHLSEETVDNGEEEVQRAQEKAIKAKFEFLKLKR